MVVFWNILRAYLMDDPREKIKTNLNARLPKLNRYNDHGILARIIHNYLAQIVYYDTGTCSLCITTWYVYTEPKTKDFALIISIINQPPKTSLFLQIIYSNIEYLIPSYFPIRRLKSGVTRASLKVQNYEI